MPPRIRLGLTMGCPCGVGPEIVARALADPWPEGVSLVVLGDEAVLEAACALVGTEPPPVVSERDLLGLAVPAALLPLSRLPGPRWGRPNEETARAMVRYIREGVRLCLEGGLHGLVTAPISKAALRLAGEPHPGHTEMLAALTRAREVAMAFYGERLKIVLVTIHAPLSRVPALLTAEGVLRAARLADRFLREDLGVARPRLALAALNPHAGEGGLFGHEEEEILAPAVEAARRLGLDLSGPHPADSLFHRAASGEFDLVVALYHDQGLIPFKLLHFRDGVNLTLGLPIVRTSVDHGTAYDLAGRGLASHESLKAAIALAARMAARRRA